MPDPVKAPKEPEYRVPERRPQDAEFPGRSRPGDHRQPGFAEAPISFAHASTPLHIPVNVPLKAPSRPASKIGVRLNRIGGAPLIIPDVAALPRALRDRTVKRALDLVLAGTFLAVFALPMAVIAALLIAEGGSALFIQPRVGRDRSRFACLKFRTMRRDAEARLAEVLACDAAAAEQWRRHQKLTRDPRITRLGRLLRTTSLDELPQLFNVLRGEMSLVGPRPIVAPEVPGYAADRAYYFSTRFDDYAGCLPGLTGLWQISGRHDTAHSERVRLDRVYARNWSVLLDIKILWRTVRVVLSRTGT